MNDFVHLHVHTEYSILDGQAFIPRLVDKAIKNGMKGMAITDHGNMMGIKEFFNYTQSMIGKAKKAVKSAQEKLTEIENGTYTPSQDGKEPFNMEDLKAELVTTIQKQQFIADFKPIFGCEMYVARRGDKTKMECRED